MQCSLDAGQWKLDSDMFFIVLAQHIGLWQWSQDVQLAIQDEWFRTSSRAKTAENVRLNINICH